MSEVDLTIFGGLPLTVRVSYLGHVMSFLSHPANGKRFYGHAYTETEPWRLQKYYVVELSEQQERQLLGSAITIRDVFLDASCCYSLMPEPLTATPVELSVADPALPPPGIRFCDDDMIAAVEVNVDGKWKEVRTPSTLQDILYRGRRQW